MEPFDVNCETCHARLRVRDERFLEQIHPCPRCGSMVYIAAPVIAPDAAADAPDVAGAAEATAGVGLAARVAGLVGRHAIVWSVCGAALVVTGSLAVSLVFRNDEEVAARADQPPAATPATAAEGPDSVDEARLAQEAPGGREPPPPMAAAASDQSRYDDAVTTQSEIAPIDSTAALPPLPVLPKNSTTDRETNDAAAVDDQSATATTPAPVSDPPDDGKPSTKRTLRLDPLKFDPSRASLGNVIPRSPPDAPPDYPSTIDLDTSDVDATPQAARPAETKDGSRPIDVAAQMAVRLKSIDMPAMTLADFAQMISEMAAVPIRFDPAAGVSPQTKVTVRGQDVTLGALLDDVLARHGLVSTVRNGAVVIVNRSAP